MIFLPSNILFIQKHLKVDEFWRRALWTRISYSPLA
jgi:hypothetical protein